MTEKTEALEAALTAVLAASTVPPVWAALAQWVAAWQGAMAPPDGEIHFDDQALASAGRQLVGHLGALDWQEIPLDRLSKSRSLTVEMHRQLMLMRTDLRFLSVARQTPKRSQLLTQISDRLIHISGYCTMGQQYLEAAPTPATDQSTVEDPS